jgi:hypothetical protein
MTLEFIGYEVPFTNENFLIRIPIVPFPSLSFRRRRRKKAWKKKRVPESQRGDLWNKTPCSLVEVYRRFESICCLYHRCQIVSRGGNQEANRVETRLQDHTTSHSKIWYFSPFVQKFDERLQVSYFSKKGELQF